MEAIQYMAIVLYCTDRYDESEAVELEALEIRRQVFPPNHPDTINAIGNLAPTWYYQGRYEEAEAAEKQALKHFQFTLGPSHPFTLEAMALLGSIYFEQERWEEAEELVSKAIGLSREPYPKISGPINMMHNLSLSRYVLSRCEEAVKMMQEVVDMGRDGKGCVEFETAEVARTGWGIGRGGCGAGNEG